MNLKINVDSDAKENHKKLAARIDPNHENNSSSLDLLHDISRLKIDAGEERSWKKLLAYLGPGFLVSIAYIDPGNFESDLQAGARFKYELLWVLLLASFGGLIIQSLSANLGVVTGQHLAQHCRSEYPKVVNFVLWVMAELTIIASDIPEVIGTAFALNMLFGLQVWAGVIVTGFSTFLLLAIQHYGVRKLEIFISILVFLIAFCFLIEVGFAKPNISELFRGLIFPRLSGTHSTAIAISLVGSVVMPHNLFLHSALVLSRKTIRTDKAIKDGCFFNLIEVSFALLIAFFINVSVIAVSGTVCHEDSLSPSDRESCNDLDLNKAPFLLKHTLGPGAYTLFAIALLASGQSSTITGTYAGQYVMEGFLKMKYQPWIRNLVTRLVAILPSLIVSLLAGSKGAGKLIIISSMILSFELPFALIPLLKFTSSEMKMGPFANSIYITILAWILGLFVISVNVYFVLHITLLWLITSDIRFAMRASLAILILISVLIYVAFIIYLIFRRDSNLTYSPLTNFSITDDQSDGMDGVSANEESDSDHGSFPTLELQNRTGTTTASLQKETQTENGLPSASGNWEKEDAETMQNVSLNSDDEDGNDGTVRMNPNGPRPLLHFHHRHHVAGNEVV